MIDLNTGLPVGTPPNPWGADFMPGYGGGGSNPRDHSLYPLDDSNGGDPYSGGGGTNDLINRLFQVDPQQGAKFGPGGSSNFFGANLGWDPNDTVLKSIQIPDLIYRAAMENGMSGGFLGSDNWNRISPYLQALVGLQGLISPSETTDPGRVAGLGTTIQSGAGNIYDQLMGALSGGGSQADLLRTTAIAQPEDMLNKLLGLLGFGNAGMSQLLRNYLPQLLRQNAAYGPENAQNNNSVLDQLMQILPAGSINY